MYIQLCIVYEQNAHVYQLGTTVALLHSSVAAVFSFTILIYDISNTLQI